ncbi:U-box domain-containing protein 52 [Morus notabilis]|uniref:U-box domain-containing protein 52 n=1 Tax=Morus notabilis TaxID=981085 RepID=UPI000CED2E77|nr:U-box domain-containing protein 52 [Morus notabilis]
MEDKECVPELAVQYYSSYNNARNYEIKSPEYVNEIVEEVLDDENHTKNSFTKSARSSSEIVNVVEVNDEVYVAVGKDDLDVVRWAIDHVVSPGARLYLVHVFPPITHIPTPVGKLSRSQLTEEQVRFYIEEEENRRRNILQKYIRLCKDAKVNVDTVLVEHDATAKAIVDLIAIHRITNLVLGLKKPPNSRILKTRMAKGEYVKKSAPEFCEVTIVHDGKKVSECQKVVRFVHSSQASSPKRSSGVTRHSERNLFLCACFSACMR